MKGNTGWLLLGAVALALWTASQGSEGNASAMTEAQKQAALQRRRAM